MLVFLYFWNFNNHLWFPIIEVLSSFDASMHICWTNDHCEVSHKFHISPLTRICIEHLSVIVVNGCVFLKLYVITYATTSKHAIFITLTSNMHLDFKGKVIIHVPYHSWNLLLHKTLAICSHYLYVVIFHAIFPIHFEMNMSIEPSFLENFTVHPLQDNSDMLSPPNIVATSSSYGMSITMIALKDREVELQNQMATLHQQSLFWIP